MGWVVNTTPRPLYPGKETRYQLYKRLDGPRSPYGRVRKISPPTWIRSPDRQTRSESLYRPRYPDPSPVQSLYRRILSTYWWSSIAGLAAAYLVLICANRGQKMFLESESRTNNPCQCVSSDGLMETDFGDRSSIKFFQDRVHCPQVPIDGAELSGNTDMRRLTTGIRSEK
jgi:hypothetical protein